MKLNKLLITTLILSVALAFGACGNDSTDRRDSRGSNNGQNTVENGSSDNDSNNVNRKDRNGAYNPEEYSRHYKVNGQLDVDKLDQLLTILTKRVNSYTTEGVVTRDGDNITIELPYITDDAIFEDITQKGDIQFVTDYGTPDEKVHMDNDMVESASACTLSDTTGLTQYVVSIQFTEEGSQIFADLTTELVDTNGVITILYNGEVLSAPSVYSAITDGVAQLSGINTYEEAQIIASALYSGALPCELELVND